MKLSGLVPLYRSMKEQNIERYKFRYTLNHLTFDCLFFIDTTPFELVMGCLRHNFVIFKNIEQGFEVHTFIEPKKTYWDLVNALKTTNDSANALNPREFFSQFNENIPKCANPKNVPTTSDIAPYYSNIEEADKIYFCGWLDNNLRNNRVSDSNLEKTQRLLGKKAYEFAKRRNQSTRWTDERGKEVVLWFPD